MCNNNVVEEDRFESQDNLLIAEENNPAHAKVKDEHQPDYIKERHVQINPSQIHPTFNN
jgi:hypothetical protein